MLELGGEMSGRRVDMASFGRTAVRNGSDHEEADRPAVDVTLIDEMLRLTPTERLRQNDRMAALAAKLREAFMIRDGRTS
jgi:hypothetical protein